MKLLAYVQFFGNCEEALKTYEKILNGKTEISERYDRPEMNVPEEFKNKIMHARFEFAGNDFFASDVMPGMIPEGKGQNISLIILTDTPDSGKKLFDKLSEGGEIHIPYEKAILGRLVW